jgi:hypothetical protein
MKFTMSVKGMNESLQNLSKAGFAIETNFYNKLIDEARNLQRKAQEILNEVTNPIYSTGKLAASIEVNALDKGRISVGPNASKAPYAEWVEFGHYMTGGALQGSQTFAKGGKVQGARWWEGHHYMEKAWLQEGQSIPSKVADTLRVNLQHYEMGEASMGEPIRLIGGQEAGQFGELIGGFGVSGKTSTGRFRSIKTGRYIKS